MNAFCKKLAALSAQLLAAAAVGLVVAAACTGFVATLRWVTQARLAHPWLTWGLPGVGFGMGYALQTFASVAGHGTRLVFAAAAGVGPALPRRLGPLVFVATALTHLVGGSAGREGAALVVGGSAAELLARLGPRDAALRGRLVLAGMAAGFSAVFATPAAATWFAWTCVVGRARAWPALPMAAVAAWVANWAGAWLLGGRRGYAAVAPLAYTPALLVKWLVFAAIVAAVASVCVQGLVGHAGGAAATAKLQPSKRMLGAGCLLLLLCGGLGSQIYLGLGDATIEAALAGEALPAGAFAWKMLFTGLTVGSGFVGGEVTPLFFVGATLGNALAPVLGLPVPLAAAVGMASLFAACTKNPGPWVVLGVEAFGGFVLPHLLPVALVACLLRHNQRGLYTEKMAGVAKVG